MAEQIEQVKLVRVMGYPMGMGAGGEAIGLPGLALVQWEHFKTDKMFQVYVNGSLAAVSERRNQRRCLVPVDPTGQAVIEVLAVASSVRGNDFSDQLVGFHSEDGSRVRLGWRREAQTELDSTVLVYGDGGSGTIDYATPLTEVAMWDERGEKWGFGLGGFGQDYFGYGDSGGVGFGEGSFGEGEFGYDVKVLSYTTGPLMLGSHQFALRVKDGAGNVNEAKTVVFKVFSDGLPLPGKLALGSYDEVNNQLVLTIS